MLAQDKTRTVLLLSLGSPPAAVSHFRGIARWPHVGLFLSGEEPFERVVQRSSDGLPVAIAPGDLALYDEIGTRTPTEPGAVARLVEAAAAHFDLVILDLPPTLTGWALHPLLAARDHDMDIVITARPTVADQAGVVQAMMLLQSLHRGTTSYSAGRLLLVLNDYHRGRDITRKEFTTGVSQLTACPLLGAVVPHNAVVRLAQNEGLPLGLVEETGDVAKEVGRLARVLGLGLRTEREGETEIEREIGIGIERGDGASRAKAKKKRPALALPGIRFKLTD